MKIERWLEKKVVQNADAVLSTTERLCKLFREVYKEQPANKFLYIPNGYDPEKVSNLNGLEKYKKFTLSYTGSFYLGRTPEPILTALRELIKEGRLDPEDIRVILMGNCERVNGCRTSGIISAYGLSKTVHVLGLASHHKALTIIKKSHLALLLAENQPFQIPAKVYDYMGAGTKILAVAEEGATSDLITSTKIGEVFRPGDVEGIKKYIYECFRNEKLGLLKTNSGSFSKFDIRMILKDLVHHMNEKMR
jgi:glycosyltransferase involved in cell wall biosynthesis